MEGDKMTKVEFLGKDHCASMKREYDAARHHLKNCGKPTDIYDVALIKIAKQTEEVLRAYA